MGHSLTIFKIKGIPVRLHWSIILLIFFVIGSLAGNGLSFESSLIFFSFIFLLFFCVLLHELGHALTAKRYGVKTKDIVLSPIGGLARLEFIPEVAIQEFMIAIAGPLVNLAIASLVSIIMLILGVGFQLDFEYIFTYPSFQSLLPFTFWMNIVLFTFNLIPAFPMDGGRIARALLSIRFGFDRATVIATAFAKVLAIIFFVYAIYYQQFILTIICAFIFITANQEFVNVKIKRALTSTRIRDLMISNYEHISLSDSFERILSLYKGGVQKSFFVSDEQENIVGCLHQVIIEDAARKKNSNGFTASDLLSSNTLILKEDVLLESLFEEMNRDGHSIVGIQDDLGKLIGVLDRNILGAFIKAQTKGSILHT